MPDNSANILKKIRGWKIIFPVLIGVGVVSYMLYKEFNIEAFSLIKFTWYSVFWLFMAFVMMATRDIGYIIRIRILTDNDLSWKKAFNVIFLWEFTSAITPSAIGGTSIAIVYVTKEGINVGRSSAVVMATSFLDELYFVIMFPLLFIIISGQELFTIGGQVLEGGAVSFTNAFFYFAVIGYSLKLAWTLLVSYGLFINPRGIKWLIIKVFKLPVLRKWKKQANVAGTDLINASKELKSKPFLFWFKAFFATFLSWSARYWVVNCLLLAFIIKDYSFVEHILIFARQLVMWIMMLIMPTPGGSGFAEFVFSKYLGEFISAGFVVTMALMWRLVSYYPYLFIGAIILPRWIKSKFGKR